MCGSSSKCYFREKFVSKSSLDSNSLPNFSTDQFFNPTPTATEIHFFFLSLSTALSNVTSLLDDDTGKGYVTFGVGRIVTRERVESTWCCTVSEALFRTVGNGWKGFAELFDRIFGIIRSIRPLSGKIGMERVVDRGILDRSRFDCSPSVNRSAWWSNIVLKNRGRRGGGLKYNLLGARGERIWFDYKRWLIEGFEID